LRVSSVWASVDFLELLVAVATVDQQSGVSETVGCQAVWVCLVSVWDGRSGSTVVLASGRRWLWVGGSPH